jgi:hypothetical protein
MNDSSANEATTGEILAPEGAGSAGQELLHL